MLTPILAIIGPTASGKTALAVAAARALNGEILSADSRQVYRGMDIGTGKDLQEYGTVPYHLIDIADAGEEYNIFRYQQSFDAAYRDVCARGKTPVLCGGSGLYITAALGTKTFTDVPENTALRTELTGKTDAELEEILRSFGPLHNHTDTETRQRCLRAIEILSYEKAHPAPARRLPAPRIFSIEFTPEELRQRILIRLEQRLAAGLVEEVRNLLEDGPPGPSKEDGPPGPSKEDGPPGPSKEDGPPGPSKENGSPTRLIENKTDRRSVPQQEVCSPLSVSQLLYYGLEYRFVTQYLTGQLTYTQMKTGLYHAICQFAKRQRTWFRKMERDGYTITRIDGHLPPGDKLKIITEKFY